jgi:hypothetical protein
MCLQVSILFLPRSPGVSFRYSPVMPSVTQLVRASLNARFFHLTVGCLHCHTGAGIALLIRNWTNTDGGTPSKYETAASGQLTYLLNEAPRAYNGAVSQRAPPEEVQVWADFMSMAPPFICYYGGRSANWNVIHVSQVY